MSGESNAAAGLRRLLSRDDDPHRPALENRVAYQWESGTDTLGYRNARLRDDTMLAWAHGVLDASPRPSSVLDMGCAYGNFLFMLNAYEGLDQAVSYLGIDIDDRGLAYGGAFADALDGFENCRFRAEDITKPLSLDSRSFDLVIAADVLEHLPELHRTLDEITRILKPSGRLIISTPLADSSFKRFARRMNALTRGSINKSYYGGKDTQLDAAGEPVMEVHAGHDHVSELPYPELVALLGQAGFVIERQQLSPIMSGSRWFDTRPWLLAGLLGLEAVHAVLRRANWAHGIYLQVRSNTS
jgi:SAM-dependent methyltransferase